jgi:stage II sporulation protein D
MLRNLILIIFFLITGVLTSNGQVRIRIFSDQHPSSAVFTAAQGRYELDIYDGKPLELREGEPVIFANYRNKIAVKIRDEKSFMCDSLIVKKLTDNGIFTLRMNGNTQTRRSYSGDLMCHSDLGVMVFINICDIEKYIAGVVRTEGGTGRHIEYLKSQAVLARTYLYKHFGRHAIDHYNFCDGTHCQAFNGITTEQTVNRSATETKGLVALDPDSNLIISAFHSNCGGETSTSDNVWLSANTHARKVIDPYCLHSPNATWKKSIPVTEWSAYLKRSGFVPQKNDFSYNFSQLTRQNNYTIGSFSIPLSKIRNDFKLKSTFFSVQKEGNNIILKGRGYGHGVGLCQEGAMVMASKGFRFSEIIGFYYPGILITDIRYAKIVKNDF